MSERTGADLTAMPQAFAVLHDDARRALTAWRASASDPAGIERVRQRMLATLDADPSAMWREHSRCHFTASLVVLDSDLTHVELTLHAKAKRWFQFGGHLEATDASVRDAALREGLEESGLTQLEMAPGLIQVDAHRLDSAFGWCTEHLDLRYAAVAVSHDVQVSDESDDVRWWPLDGLPVDTDPSLRDAIDCARRALSSL